MKTNRIKIIRNEQRTTDKQPTHKGEGNLDGIEFEVALWVEEEKDGRKYFSGTVKPKRAGD